METPILPKARGPPSTIPQGRAAGDGRWAVGGGGGGGRAPNASTARATIRGKPAATSNRRPAARNAQGRSTPRPKQNPAHNARDRQRPEPTARSPATALGRTCHSRREKDKHVRCERTWKIEITVPVYMGIYIKTMTQHHHHMRWPITICKPNITGYNHHPQFIKYPRKH